MKSENEEEKRDTKNNLIKKIKARAFVNTRRISKFTLLHDENQNMSLIPRGLWNPFGEPQQRAGPLSGA